MAPLRAMSFNVRYGNAEDGEYAWPRRREAAIDVVRRYSPDVAGLQEALDYQVDEFAAAMPGFSCVGAGRDDGLRQGEFAAILFRAGRLDLIDSGTFWFSQEPLTPGSRHPECYHPRICTWATLADRESGVRFRVCNLHLDNESEDARFLGVDMVLSVASGEADFLPLARVPTLVLGDFNVGEDHPCIESLHSRGFSDSYRLAHPDDGIAGTYHGFGTVEAVEKIDFIFTDRSWSVSNAGIIREKIDGHWPSDHYPVTAEVSVVS
ncbi:MAG TPA: endonuclease/exonuclease/phosphatase family protein [Fimbriimonadaceae bacterium]|nr:endonuclease/exonuclease/phosphatase family protein [Fimbriimonadaceae bacterium]